MIPYNLISDNLKSVMDMPVPRPEVSTVMSMCGFSEVFIHPWKLDHVPP